MKAYLILEDGHVFEGESFGYEKEVISEFVFNTSMTGANIGTPLYCSGRSSCDICKIFGFPLNLPKASTLCHFKSAAGSLKSKGTLFATQ